MSRERNNREIQQLGELVQQVSDKELATAHTTGDTITFLCEFFDDRLTSLHTQVSYCLTIETS